MSPTVIKILDPTIPCSTEYFSVNGNRAKKREWIDRHELLEASTNFGPRVVTPVKIRNDVVDRILMMDVVTGSLYDRSTGRCMTSRILYMTRVSPKKGLGEKLLAMQAEE